jgi:hypothetical protein
MFFVGGVVDGVKELGIAPRAADIIGQHAFAPSRHTANFRR